MSTVNLTTAAFDRVVADNDIVFIDFWAGWCGPCRAFAPIYERASGRHEDIVFAKVDTETEQGLAARFGVRSIPTLAVLRDGIALFLQPGVLPDAALDDLAAQVRALDMDAVRASLAAEAETAAG